MWLTSRKKQPPWIEQFLLYRYTFDNLSTRSNEIRFTASKISWARSSLNKQYATRFEETIALLCRNKSDHGTCHFEALMHLSMFRWLVNATWRMGQPAVYTTSNNKHGVTVNEKKKKMEKRLTSSANSKSPSNFLLHLAPETRTSSTVATNTHENRMALIPAEEHRPPLNENVARILLANTCTVTRFQKTKGW